MVQGREGRDFGARGLPPAGSPSLRLRSSRRAWRPPRRRRTRALRAQRHPAQRRRAPGRGQSYSGAIESRGDRDYFYFYVTSAEEARGRTPRQEPDGGGTEISDVDATIINTPATPGRHLRFIRKGETRVASFWLRTARNTSSKSPRRKATETPTPSPPAAAAAPSAATTRSHGAARRPRTRRAHSGPGCARPSSKLQRATNRLRRARYADSSVRQDSPRANCAGRRSTSPPRSASSNASQAAQTSLVRDSPVRLG